MPFDLDAYLDRIRYEGPLAADEGTLTRLHEAHVGMIPFENLDLGLGRPIRLELDALAAKLVTGRRGGYCFEHGTLFKAALDRIGFTSHILTARVRFGAPGRVSPRTHMLLKVDTPSGAVIADVGFGGEGLLHPVPLLPDLVFHVPGAAYRLRHEGHYWVLEGDIASSEFKDYYAFTLEPHFPIDIEMANHFMATHPASPFLATPTAQLTRPHERVVLRGRRLERRTPGGLDVRTIDDEALIETLAAEFDLRFPPGTRFAFPAER